MTTLIDTVIPNEKYLDTMLSETTDGDFVEEEYKKKATDNLIEIIKANPLMYITYGPWWPALKTILIDHGYDLFGQIVESDVAKIYSYPRPALTILAGIIYSMQRLDEHVFDDRYHYLEVNQDADDTEPYLYFSADMSIDKYQQKS